MKDNFLSKAEFHDVVAVALAEDVGSGDVTTLATVSADLEAWAGMLPRETIVVAGLALVQEVFVQLSEALPGVPKRPGRVQVELLCEDGQTLQPGQPLLRIRGPARVILTGERVALNYMQRLSGIATLTARFVKAVEGTRARILDTRKTTPGWRRLEKYAVKCGGGQNHRFGLYDMVLIKDNHLAALDEAVPCPVKQAVESARSAYPGLKVEVEADTLEQVEQALAAGADMVLLDNMSLEQMKEAVAKCAGRMPTEASGGVNLQTVRSIAETGVDFISVGALTHSARAVDIGLDFEH